MLLTPRFGLLSLLVWRAHWGAVVEKAAARLDATEGADPFGEQIGRIARPREDRIVLEPAIGIRWPNLKLVEAV